MLHTRDAIMDNVETALQAIVNVAPPVADGGNSGTPLDLVVSSSGDYTGSTANTFTVEVTTGGASGTAKVKVDAGSPVTVTSGTPILIGNGAYITFTFSGSLVLGDKWTVACSFYNTTVKQVLRAKATGQNVKTYPTIVIARVSQAYEQVDGPSFLARMTIVCEAWIEERTNVDQELEDILEDMEYALQTDPGRGGYAIETNFIRTEAGVPVQGQPYGVVSLLVEVTYKHTVNPS